MSTACNAVHFRDSEEGHHFSCSICQDLPFRNESWSPFYRPDFEDEGRIWYTKVSYELLSKSQRECPYCNLLFQVAKAMMENIGPAISDLVTFRFGWWWDGSSNLSVKINSDSLMVDELFHLYITKGQSRSMYQIPAVSKGLSEANNFKELNQPGQRSRSRGIFRKTVVRQSVCH